MAIASRMLAYCAATLLTTGFVALPTLQPQGPPPVLDTVLAARCGAECDVVTGTVYDSLGKTPLSAALVVASPSGVMIATDSLGHFQLVSDQRIDRLTVYHDVLEHTGLGALGLSRPEGTTRWRNVQLATPAMATLWPQLCDSKRPINARATVLTGTARLPDNRTRVAGAKVLVQWPRPANAAGGSDPRTMETVTDSLGNYLFCGVEEYVEPALVALSEEARSGVVHLPSDPRPLRRVDLILAPTDSGASRGTVRGRVVTEQRAPLPNVRVSLDGEAQVAVTTADGSFVLRNVPFGSRMLFVRAIGYSPVAQSVDVLETPGELLTIPLTRTIELEGVTVTERVNVRGDRRDFEWRKRAGWGRFVDSLEIMRAPNVRAALARVPAIRVRGVGASTEFDLRGRFNCPAHLFMDHTQATLDDVNAIPPANLAAVEVYSSVAFAPAEFIQIKADNCAVVIFWTKYGLRP